MTVTPTLSGYTGSVSFTSTVTCLTDDSNDGGGVSFSCPSVSVSCTDANGDSDTTDIWVTVANPDFSLSANPGSVSVSTNSPAKSWIRATPTVNLPDSVMLTGAATDSSGNTVSGISVGFGTTAASTASPYTLSVLPMLTTPIALIASHV